MNTLARVVDLDDARALVDADLEGVLRAAASSGAQVRAVAAAVGEGALARLDGFRPRSVVFVAVRGAPLRAAQVLVAALADRLTVPVLVVGRTPLWVGPLDAVVVAGDDAGDHRLAEAVDLAARRGAEVVAVTPDEGPMRAAGAGRVMKLEPRVRVPDSFGFARYLAAGVAVVAALGVAQPPVGPQALAALADDLDGQAQAGAPDREVYRNSAKTLAERLSGRRVVVAGDTPATVALAAHCAAVLLRVAGVVAGAADLADVLVARPQLEGAGASSPHDLLFHDEEFDGPAPGGSPARVLLLAAEAAREALTARSASLGDVYVVVRSEAEVPGAVPPGAPGTAPGLGELTEWVLLASRFELASAYVKVAGAH